MGNPDPSRRQFVRGGNYQMELKARQSWGAPLSSSLNNSSIHVNLMLSISSASPHAQVASNKSR